LRTDFPIGENSNLAAFGSDRIVHTDRGGALHFPEASSWIREFRVSLFAIRSITCMTTTSVWLDLILASHRIRYIKEALTNRRNSAPQSERHWK
jgi:hypothetical protein